MKLIINLTLIIAVGVLLQSCGNNKIDQSESIEQGKVLLNASDCNTCHHQNNRIVGPSHTDVAKKYETTKANVKLLADRIIKGSSGVWGDIPMNSHTDLSQEDAEKMIRFILSLDEQ